jgi:acyl-CoA synthetase (AMP-forming)/AMP-acid ligase II
MSIVVRERGAAPFDMSGIERDSAGILRYVDRPASVVVMLEQAVEANPQAEALVEVGGRRMSYRELWERSRHVAGGLRERGVTAGDRVALRAPNGIDWVLAFFGTLMAGAVVVPVNLRFKDDEVRYVVEDSGAVYSFEPGEALADGEPVEPHRGTPDELAAIFYTSGTTGSPKGAATTHGNFMANSETAIRVIGFERDLGSRLRTLVSVPLFHVTGCNSQLLPVLELGGSVVILAKPDIGLMLQTIEQERTNYLISVPAIYNLLIRHERFAGVATDHVRWLAYGGAPIAPALVHRLQECFPRARVGNGFGQTEAASILTYLPHEHAAEHADSVGFAAPVVELALDQPDEQGVGELLARGPNIVSGYWNKPEATRATFVDGWLHTGDLAAIDEQGLTYVVDRAKDMINRGGENVYSVEIENALAGAPGVAEAAALPVPDDVLGEKVGVVIVPAAGATIEPRAIAAYVAERLADFKVPQYVAIRSEPLPRNAGGKVLKRALRDGIEWGTPLR